MNCDPCEDYAKEADPVPRKTQRPRPKKEVAKKPDPAKIFDGATKPRKRKPKKKRCQDIRRRNQA